MANEKEQLPVWLSSGIEPPQSLKENGWQAGVKPPAQYMDWFFNRTYMVLKQLQESGGANELIGDITQLSTQDKTNIVQALNEMNTKKVNTSDKATIAEAEAGTNDTKYMTPLKTTESILTLFGSLVATQTNAVAGTANDKIMTPLRVSDVTGKLSALQTTNKTNIVQAVNEVKAGVTQHLEQSAVGAHKASNIAFAPPSGMTATDTQSAIQEVFQSGVNAKAEVVTAVNAKGGTVTTSDDWSSIASAIEALGGGIKSIQTGSANLAVNSTSLNIDIEDVDLSKAIVLINSIPSVLSGTSPSFTAGLIKYNLTTTNTITVERNTGLAVSVALHYTVIECDNFEVQRGNVTGSSVATIEEVVASNSFVLTSFKTSVSVGGVGEVLDAYKCDARLNADGARVHFSKGTSAYNWTYQVIEIV